jgi:hypothetical protein
MGIKITGLSESLQFLRGVVPDAQANLEKGVVSAALIYEGACTKEITTMLYSLPEPADKPRKRTGNLRASRFTCWTGGSTGRVPTFKASPGPIVDGFNQSVSDAEGLVASQKAFSAMVGYGAFYALYVHEALGINWMTVAFDKTRETLFKVVSTHLKGTT